MLIIWGQRMYGRVDRFAGSYVVTRFFHIYYLPLIPLSSWLVLEEQGEGRFHGIQLRMQGRSVLTAWLRIFGIVAFLAALPALFNYERQDTSHIVLNAAYTIALLGLSVFAWFRLGKLDEAAKVARIVYSDFVGQFVDVGLLKDAVSPGLVLPTMPERGLIKARVTEELERHLSRHATSTYRDAPQASWRQVATHPDMRDVPLLKAALTRCRLEEVEAQGAKRGELKRDHASILRNLLIASPELRDVKRYELAR